MSFVRAYICDRCGKQIPISEIQHYDHNNPNSPIVGRIGYISFHIRREINQGDSNVGWKNRTVIMCKSCWDEFGKAFNDFMGGNRNDR